MKEITIRVKSQYGASVIQPVCDNANIFAHIAGTKTLTRDTIERIKALGYTVKVEQTQPKEL